MPTTGGPLIMVKYQTTYCALWLETNISQMRHYNIIETTAVLESLLLEITGIKKCAHNNLS